MFSNYEISLIKRSDSRKYFEDVLQSFYSKNYRAAVLLLYSLVIDDLYYKLMLMNDRKYYNLNDDLKRIEELGKSDKYSEIEEKIFNTYKNILNHDTIDMLEYFKKIRNKCAHPSYFKDEKYTPIQEEVNLFIMRIYNDILIKEAFIKDPYSIIKPDIQNKEWGGIMDVNMGYTTHEMNYVPFKIHFTNKYLKGLTDNNFQKLFNDLIKVIVIKNGEWEKIHQYSNMMLMESMLEYLNDIGKMSILENCYDWSKLQEEYLYDDNDTEIYKNEWFALTNLYKILTYNKFFMQEIILQNEVIYNFLKNRLLSNRKYIINYWNLFFQTLEEGCSKIESIEVKMALLKEDNFVTKNNAIKFLKDIFDNIPTSDAFSIADETCDLLIKCIDDYELSKVDIDDILKIMNRNSQIYFAARRKRNTQIESIKSKGIELSEYINLN